MRNRSVRRILLFSKMLFIIAILQLLYDSYKFNFYSADCNPTNDLPITINSLFDTVSLACDFIVWFIPILIFFWPTKQKKRDERTYRRTRKRWSAYESSRSSTTVQDSQGFSDDSDDSDYDSEDGGDFSDLVK